MRLFVLALLVATAQIVCAADSNSDSRVECLRSVGEQIDGLNAAISDATRRADEARLRTASAEQGLWIAERERLSGLLRQREKDRGMCMSAPAASAVTPVAPYAKSFDVAMAPAPAAAPVQKSTLSRQQARQACLEPVEWQIASVNSRMRGRYSASEGERMREELRRLSQARYECSKL